MMTWVEWGLFLVGLVGPREPAAVPARPVSFSGWRIGFWLICVGWGTALGAVVLARAPLPILCLWAVLWTGLSTQLSGEVDTRWRATLPYGSSVSRSARLVAPCRPKKSPPAWRHDYRQRAVDGDHPDLLVCRRCGDVRLERAVGLGPVGA